MLKKVLLAAAFCCGLALVAQARVYYLPDYQKAFLYGSRVEQSNASPHTTTPTCNTYGLYSAASRPSNAECTLVQDPIPGLSCYRCTICANTYIYNSSNCTGEYVLSGSSCAGKYDKCICNPDKYATTADGSGCDTGQKADTSTSCVDKTTGKTLYTCIADPCYGLADNTSELGCDKYYDQCPSKCQLGSTCKPADCSAYTLTSCPSGSTCESCTPGCGDNAKRYKCTPQSCSGYTLSSCPSGSTCSSCTPGCGNNTKKYKEDCRVQDCSGYTLSSCPAGSICGSCAPGCGNNTTKYKELTALAFQVNPYAGGKISFSISGNNYQIDWGDGTVNTSTSHTYQTAGYYNIEVSGDVKSFSINSGVTARPKKIYSLNLPKATKINFKNACSTLGGTIPPLPDSLTDGTEMFSGCNYLTGSFPKLPANLKYGTAMFYKCINLKGNIPSLPSSLTDGSKMFYDCGGLTGSIPKLPANLENGTSMFFDCSSLSGSIPTLPSSLRYGREMFAFCSGLTGKIPALPTNLYNGTSMFYECTGLTGNIPALPTALEYGTAMFASCKGLTGSIPALPAKLEFGQRMFASCTGLTGSIPKLPDTLTKAGMYEDVIGPMFELGQPYTDGGMFEGCTGLSGKAPAKPWRLDDYKGIFADTNVTNDGSWRSKAWEGSPW